ncbi:MAG: hypothetical protein JNL73_12725, partial [Anaerolineales bacterium]|nr:hypothetical protein [Anaerolineales bacterium]
ILAAELARNQHDLPVFWLTLTDGVSETAAAIIRALALFGLAHGQARLRPILDLEAGASPLPLDQQLNLLRAALNARPMVLCLDDAHLALTDPAGQALLENLAATTTVTLLLTSRERLPLPVPQLTVRGLDLDQARALIVDYGFDPTASWAADLIERTGGNPMLLRLALGQLNDPATDPARFVLRLASQPQIAAFLMNAVLRRLSPRARWLVELVAVFRQPIDLFDPVLAEAIARAHPATELADDIQALQAHALIDDAHLAGLHPLLREHLLAHLATDPRRKRSLHRLAADWSQQSSGDVLEVLYHAANAGQIERMADAIRGQEEAVAARGQATAAAQVLAQVIRNLGTGKQSEPKRRRLRELSTSRGILLIGGLQAREAEADFRRALDLTQDPQTRADLVAWTVTSILERNAYSEALALIAEAKVGLRQGDAFLRARLEASAAWAHYDLSQIDEAARAGETALALLEPFGRVPWQGLDATRAMAHSAMASISRARQNVVEAFRHGQAAVDTAERGGRRRMAVSKRGFLGGLNYDRGDLDEADRLRGAALQAAQELGDSYTVAYMNMYLSDHDRIRLTIDQGLKRLDVVQELMDQIGDRHGQADQVARRAAFLLWRGQVAAAVRLLEGPLVGSNADLSSRSHGYNLNRLVFAQLVAGPGRWTQARETLDRALDLAETSGDRMLRFNLGTTQAALWLTAGDPAEANGCLAAAPAHEGFGLWGRLERRLVGAMVAWASGDKVGSQLQFSSLQEQAAGFAFFAVRMARVLAEPTYIPTRIPRLLWCAEATPR